MGVLGRIGASARLAYVLDKFLHVDLGLAPRVDGVRSRVLLFGGIELAASRQP
jgi:hypothetical protein